MARRTEQAVSSNGGRFHRLRPGALVGTLLCGSRLPLGPSTWRPVDQVPVERRCKRCFRGVA